MNHDDAKDIAKINALMKFGDQTGLTDMLDIAIDTYRDSLTAETPEPAPLPSPVPLPPSAPLPGGIGDFKVYGIMRHRNQPDLRTVGIEPLDITYEGGFFDSSRVRTDAGYSVQDVNLSKVVSQSQRASKIWMPDIERWAHKDSWEVPDENVRRYVQVAQTIRRNLPSDEHKFGFYSIMPVRNYWGALEGVGSSRYRQWQEWNDQVAPIVDHVDMLFPSLYAISSVFQGAADRHSRFERFAVANITEARRIGQGKPVYGVLWPWWHPGGKAPIDKPFMRFQLDLMRKHADGLVVWDDLASNRQDFQNMPSYWDAIQEFIDDIN